MRRYALRDDQWDRIKDILPERQGHEVVQPKIIAYLLKLFYIDTELAYLGGIYLSALETLE